MSKKGTLVAIIALVVIALAAAIIFRQFWMGPQESSESSQAVCSDSIIARSAEALGADDVDIGGYSSIADEVRALDDYESDINCVFIVMKYDDLVYAVSDTKDGLGVYRSLYDDGGRLDNRLDPNDSGEPDYLSDELMVDVEAEYDGFDGMVTEYPTQEDVIELEGADGQ